MHLKKTAVIIFLFCSLLLVFTQVESKTNFNTRNGIEIHLKTPAFLREGDLAYLTVNIHNKTNAELTGQMQLQLTDAATGNPVDGWFVNTFPVQYFTASQRDSVAINFPIQVPYGFNQPILLSVKAVSGNCTDSAKNTIPIFPNRAIIHKNFSCTFHTGNGNSIYLKDLNNANEESISNKSFTAIIATQPIWQAIEALKKLQFANKNNPMSVVSQFFSQQLLQNYQTLPACLSLLPSPVFTASNNTQPTSKFNFFHLSSNAPQKELQDENAIESLKKLQQTNGSFATGLNKEVNALLTAKIITILSKVYINHQTDSATKAALFPLMQQGLLFVQKSLSNTIAPDLTTTALLYCYSKSLLKNWLVTYPSNTILFNSLKKHATQYTLANQALMGAILQQYNDTGLLYKTILQTIQQSVITSANNATASWPSGTKDIFSPNAFDTQIQIIQFLQNADVHQYPFIKTVLPKALHTLALQIQHNNNIAESWLIAQAGALILQERILLNPPATLTLGNHIFSIEKNCNVHISGNSIDSTLAHITIQTSQNETSIFYGNIQWQYLQDVAAIPATHQSWKLSKKLFVQKTFNHQTQLQLLSENEALAIGDTIMIQLSIQNTLPSVKAVTITDNYSACMQIIAHPRQSTVLVAEQINLSGNHFFIASLPKGKTNLQYFAVITQSGRFSSGIASIAAELQEYKSYAPSIQINVSEKKN